MFEFLVHVLSMACIYGLLALSLNLQVGFAGLVNFGQIVLFGCGTYGAAMAFSVGWPAGFGLLAGLVLSTIVGLIFAQLGRNLGADYWAIATLSVAEIVRITVNNEAWLTGGAQGIYGLPLLMGAARPYDGLAQLALLLLLLALGFLACRHLTQSRLGLAMRLMREEPDLARALGHDLGTVRRTTMVLSGFLAATAGFVFAHYITFVGPEQMAATETFVIWSMVLVGGLANHVGVIAGAFAMQFALAYVPFVKDFLDLPNSFVAAARLLIVGGGILGFLLFRPAGLIPEKVGKGRV